MKRYGKVLKKDYREIVLLKSNPCSYGKCTFCDYINDNSTQNDIVDINHKVQQNVTGEVGKLEIINSGNFIDIPKQTWHEIKQIIQSKDITEITVENHWIHRHRNYDLYKELQQLNCKINFKIGVETFNQQFREVILNKGMGEVTPSMVRQYYNQVNLLVGIQGQTKEQILQDILLGVMYFDKVVINMYQNNSTDIKKDEELQKWFLTNFYFIESAMPYKVELLYNNTDYNVG